MTIHWIDRGTSPLLCTRVSLCTPCTSDSSFWAYFYLKRRRLVKDMTAFITSMLLDPYPNQRLTILGSLHFLPSVLNVFLSRYDLGTFLSHLAAGEYGFDIIGSPCIDIYQMYVVVPMFQGGIPYIGVGLVY